MLPDNKAASSKIARNRNVNANSVSAKNKVAANRAVAVKRVVSKADDRSGYLEKKAAGGDSRRFVCLCTTRITRYRFYGSVSDFEQTAQLGFRPIRQSGVRLIVRE